MKKIHQIFISDDDNPISGFIKEKVDQLKLLYFNYDYTLYNKKTLRELIINNFDNKVLRAYDTISAYAFKADLGRMCVLYLYGGYYFDLSICPSEKYEFTEDIVLVKGISHKIHTQDRNVIENNFLYVKKPGHPFIKSVIDRIVDNVTRLDYGIHPLDITSPITIGRVIEKFEGIENIGYAQVKLYENKDKYVVYKNKHFYDFKPAKYNADISKVGATGTNRYDVLWFKRKAFNINFSIVVATNYAKPKIFKICYNSWIDNMREGDELIIVGKCNDKEIINNPRVIYIEKEELSLNAKLTIMKNIGAKRSNNNYIVHIDDDVLFHSNFLIKAEEFINKNSPNHFNVKILLPNGGRYWDRAIIKSSVEDMIKAEKTSISNASIPIELELVNYNYVSKDYYMWYNGSIVFVKNNMNIEWPEDKCKYNNYDGYEIFFSIDLQDKGDDILIDSNNYVFHFSFDYNEVINNGVHQIHKGKHHNIVKNKDWQILFNKTVRKYSRAKK
jgi:mannosyltransferase OCH1-like enzyme